MSRKTKRITYKSVVGARLLRANGGLVYCDNCEKIVGSINDTGYNFMMLVFCCTCGNYGCIEISRNKMRYNSDFRVNNVPKTKRVICSCVACDENLFSIFEDRIENYSFFVECRCGEQYDIKPNFEKRLGETLRLFKQAREKR